MSKERTTIWFEEDTLRLIDGMVDEAREDPELGDEIGRGMLVRHLVKEGIDATDGKLRDLMPDTLLEKYRIKHRKERRKDRDYQNKLAAYWRQNVNRELTKFYDDEAPARPRKVRMSMETWREEAEDVYDDETELAEDLEWLDRKLDEYEDAVRLAEVVPDRGFDRVSGEIAVGADLWQLRPDALDLVTDVEDLADGDATNPDAIVDRLAADYGVATEAIEEFLDLVVRDDVDVGRALKGYHGEDGPERFREVVDPRALGDGSPLAELLAADDDGETLAVEAAAELPADDDRADAAEATAAVDGEEVAETEETENAADAEEVEATPDGGDRAGGLSPADMAREEVIERAAQLLEAGEDPDMVVHEVRKIANGENERKAAVAAARERLADRGVDVEVDPADAVATDGGEDGE